MVLVIGGTDPVHGAGVTADLHTLSRHSVRGAVCVTAVTVQDTCGVHSVTPIPADVVADQIRFVFGDLHVTAVKIGLLGSGEVAVAVAKALETTDVPIVLDPVLVSSSGRRLLDDEGIEILRYRLAPRAALVTPNRNEALALFGSETPSSPVPVLVTGGDGDGATVTDVLYLPTRLPTVFRGRRHPGPTVHGTGCRLSTAIAARLSRREDLEIAVACAIRWTRAEIKRAQSPGHGMRLWRIP